MNEYQPGDIVTAKRTKFDTKTYLLIEKTTVKYFTKGSYHHVYDTTLTAEEKMERMFHDETVWIVYEFDRGGITDIMEDDIEQTLSEIHC